MTSSNGISADRRTHTTHTHTHTMYQTQDGFWGFVTSNSVSCKSVVAVLHYYMKGCDESPESAALAASIYLAMLQMPGSGTRKLQQPMVTRSVFAILEQWRPASKASKAAQEEEVHLGKKRKASSPVKATGGGAKAKRGKAAGAASAAGVGASAASHIMLGLMQAFVSALQRYKLSIKEDCQEDVIMLLLGVTRLNWPNNRLDADTWKDDTASPLALAYQGLAALCAEPIAATHVAQQLVYSVAMRFEELVTGSVPARLNRVREHAEMFVAHMLTMSDCLPAVKLLVQHTCTKIPDRAPYRTAVASTVANLTAMLPEQTRDELMVWITKYSRNQRIGYRVFALELAPHFLNGPASIAAAAQIAVATTAAARPQARAPPATPRSESQMDEDGLVNADTPKSAAQSTASAAPSASSACNPVELFMHMVISRASDKAPTVRSKALGIIAQVFAHPDTAANQPLLDAIKAHLAPSMAELSSAVQAKLSGSPAPASAKKAATLSANKASTAGGLLSILARRANDTKSAVRKSALQALEAMTAFAWYNVGQEELAALHQGCIDPATTVRKQALLSLTAILKRFPTEDSVRRAWLECIMPLTLDKEETISRKAIEALHDFILKPASAKKLSDDNVHQTLAWQLLSVVDEKQDLRRYLQRLCGFWDREGVFKKSIFDNLIAYVSNPSTTGGWSLLSDMASCKPQMVNTAAIVEAWRSRELDDLTTTAHVLTIIGYVAARLDKAVCNEISNDLKSFLQQFTAAAGNISVMLQTAAKLDIAVATASGAALGANGLAQATQTFAVKLLGKCEAQLGKVVFSKDPVGSYDEVSVVRQLFTLGEASLICPEGMTERQTLVVQALMAENVPGLDLANESAFPGKSSHAPAVRAHAFLTIGKLCLQNEELSKTVITTMVRELDHCKDPAVRNNVVVVMTDLCVRHPNLIQPYLPTIASCLRDPTVMVRRQTVTLLTRLLKEDYIKLRGALFFRLLMCLVDDDEGVRTLGEFCVLNLLLEKDAGLFPVHFVECIFHFNSVQTHSIYNKFPQSERDVESFNLSGAARKSKRMSIYTTMLGKFQEFDKLQMAQRLSQEVLGAIAEGTMKLDASTEAVLADTLAILSSDAIKLNSRSAEEEDPDVAAAAKATSVAKATLITKVVKKNMVENIVPLVIALKAHLERVRSPMMKNLMMYLRQLFHDYKDEVGDIMAADKQLANEILYDMRKFEEEQAAAKQALLAKSPAVRSGKSGNTSFVGTPFASPGLRDATPQNSPLLSPSIFASAGQPGSPKFKAPLLRGQGGSGGGSGKGMGSRANSFRKSRLSVVSGSFAGTPASNAGTPRGAAASSSDGAGAAVGGVGGGSKQLAWVRTPLAKSRSGSGLSNFSSASNLIKLATPGSSSMQKPWSIKASAASAADDDCDDDGISAGATKRAAADENMEVSMPRAKMAAQKSTRGGSRRAAAAAM